MTDIYALIQDVRNSYVDGFRDFVEEQHKISGQGSAEVKIELGGQSKLFGGMYCVDFVSNDDGNSEVIEFVMDRYFSFTGLRGQLGELNVTFASMRWNDTIITHDLATLPAAALTPWFEQWFDPSDNHHDMAAEFSGTIHSLMVEPGALTIDFGTATPDAFWTLLNLLEEAGSRVAAIRCAQ